MKKIHLITILILFLILPISGCYMKEAKIIMGGKSLQPINLPTGSRILMCEAFPKFASYEIKKMPIEIISSNMVIVYPPDVKYDESSLPKTVKKMATKMDVDMIFVAVIKKNPSTQKYDILDINKKVVGHFALYQFTCEVYQYNGNGELIGYKYWYSEFPEKLVNWPPDVSLWYDGRVDFKKWLDANLSSN